MPGETCHMGAGEEGEMALNGNLGGMPLNFVTTFLNVSNTLYKGKSQIVK